MEVEDAECVIRVAIVNDYAVVVAGIAALLKDESVDVVETGALTLVSTDVDIVLFDTFGQVQGDGLDIEDFVRDSHAKVVIYSWNLQPELIARAVEAGASGYLSKALTGTEIVEALGRIMRRQIVICAGDQEMSVDAAGDWPGRAAGLSPREAEVIALITQGLTNQQIADRAYLSINSIKQYISSAFRKIDVTTRTQAALWGSRNGYEPEPKRMVDPALRVRPVQAP